MAVLITGGAGYIGAHTAVELLQNGEDIVIVDNFVNSKPEVLDAVRTITGRDFPFYEADLLDRDAVDRIFSENEIDTVIHFAGLKAVGESVSKPLEYYHNNLTGTFVLCDRMRAHSVKRMVFSSSATVYGNPQYVPLDESHPLSTTNPYGATKLFLEQILSDLAAADPAWSVVLLRYFNPIGAHKSGLIGEDPNGIPNNLLPYVSQVAAGILKEVSVFGDDYPTPDGTAYGTISMWSIWRAVISKRCKRRGKLRAYRFIIWVPDTAILFWKSSMRLKKPAEKRSLIVLHRAARAILPSAMPIRRKRNRSCIFARNMELMKCVRIAGALRRHGI